MIFALSVAAVASAAEFSADLTRTENGKVVKSRHYRKGVMVRDEDTAKGIVQIIRPDKHVSWIIVPNGKLYFEQALPANAGTKSTVRQWADLAKTNKDVRKLGTETVDGYTCDKYTLTRQVNLNAMTKGHAKGGKSVAVTVYAWLSPQLDQEVKVFSESSQGTSSAELTNIKEQKLPASLFEVPAGYTKHEMASGPGRKGMARSKGVPGIRPPMRTPAAHAIKGRHRKTAQTK
jgi:hypothetical protein